MKPQRLDKLLAQWGGVSRKEAKEQIRKGQVRVNGVVAQSPEQKVEWEDSIDLGNRRLQGGQFLYLMMNKPAGVLSATRDPKAPTVLDLLPLQYQRKGLFPAGRLDKDTEGFVLLTDDGEFAHRLLSPRYGVPKTYLARLDGSLEETSAAEAFEKGLELSDGTLCLPAQLRVLEGGSAPLVEVVICQGMYHQVKRMFQALGREVVWLRREKMGNLALDPDLASGEVREISNKELDEILDRLTENESKN